MQKIVNTADPTLLSALRARFAMAKHTYFATSALYGCAAMHATITGIPPEAHLSNSVQLRIELYFREAYNSRYASTRKGCSTVLLQTV